MGEGAHGRKSGGTVQSPMSNVQRGRNLKGHVDTWARRYLDTVARGRAAWGHGSMGAWERGCGETSDRATERLGERARSKAENETSVETTKAGFNRDGRNKEDKGNPRILLRHSGHGRAVSRNPGL